MVASSGTWRKSGLRLSSSRIATIATGVSKNWASCHPMKPVRQPPSKRPPELQNRVQTIRAGTDNNSLSFSTRKLNLVADVVVTAESVAAYKPDHHHFHTAFDRFAELGIARDQILHVPQSFGAEVIPANHLGMHSPGIKRPRRTPRPPPRDAKQT